MTQETAELAVTQVDYDRADEHRQRHGLNSINRDHLAETLARHRADIEARALAGWNDAESRLGTAQALNRLLSEQLDRANASLSASPPVNAADTMQPAPAGDAELIDTLLSVRKVLTGIAEHKNADPDDILAALIAIKLIDVTASKATPPSVPAQQDRWAGVIPLVEKIVEDEGATVTFTGPNPDFNGLPNECVTVCGPSTNWTDKAFRADTLADCLRAATPPAQDQKGDGDYEAREAYLRRLGDDIDVGEEG